MVRINPFAPIVRVDVPDVPLRISPLALVKSKVPLTVNVEPPEIVCITPRGSIVVPLFIVRGALELKVLPESVEIVPVFAIITPPDAVKVTGHSSTEDVRAVAVLYCSVPAEPYVTAPLETTIIAVPSIESTPFTVGVVAKVLVLAFEIVRFE